MYGSGISKIGDMLDLAANNGIVEKAGAWFSYNNSKLGQGRENSKAFLEQNPELVEEIKQKLLVKFGLIAGADTSSIDTATGEILEDSRENGRDEEKSKKSKKVIQ
jgi:recombination protein RecA